MSSFIEKLFSPPINDYKKINKSKYYKSFGLKKKKGKGWKVKDKNKLKNAYQKAWENRDFEINKFWTRAAYYWGFIALIFAAFFTIPESRDKSSITLIIICLGIIFSVAWHYAIRGSKRWQENWEKHIDRLEDYVSGPLYKTIYHKNTFYSVSKINETLSVVIIFLWVGLLFRFLLQNNFIIFDQCCTSLQLCFDVILILLVTLVFVISIIFGYSRNQYNNKKNKLIRRKPDKK